MEEPKSHFILVHGGCHGAWCWYKLATLLRSKGHRVTTPDLGASGINLTRLEELETISQYSQPLMDVLGSLPVEEKVILVAHSFGGASVSLAMEKFPQKISVAVFATAFMPGPDCPFTVHLQQYYSRLDSQLDNQYFFHNGTDKLPTAFVLGNETLATKLYQNCPMEVLTLAKMLVRPVFLSSEANVAADVVLSNEKYGSVPRVYILCDEDKILKPDFQMWMIENNPTLEVKEIQGADHMVMLSKPLELCEYLHGISKTDS